LANFVYVELQDSVQVSERAVRISDVASVFAADAKVLSKVKHIILYRFPESSGDSTGRNGTKESDKQVISLLWLTSQIQAQIPDVVVIPHGESDCIVELIKKEQNRSRAGMIAGVKVALVSLICLLGGAFSIMAFHNDISVTNIFSEFYTFVTGELPGQITILEISYSFGLLAGILVFYNHLGKKKFSMEATPIEVSMRTYERDMDEALIKRRDREGKVIDVE